MQKANLVFVGLGLLLALLAYFYGLDSIHIPTIGDEAPYIQITRVTGSSGTWLPLKSDQGIKNTKPPLLFWQGMISTGFAQRWSLWNLRIPVVLTSLMVALLVGFLVYRISGDGYKSWLSGLIYLGFMSTFQHGRPFLMHAAETLFLFLPLILVFRAKKLTLRLSLCLGLFLGLAALYKSFFLIFAGAFALGIGFWAESRWDRDRPFHKSVLFLAVAVLVALVIFSLWLWLDPQPELILKDFFLEENLGKFSISGFFQGLFSGPYTLFRIWFGNFANAGLYVFLLLALLIDLFKRRKSIPKDEKRLWLYILGFLLIYSLPTQRQENYILPTCAALSVLLALRWHKLPGWALRLSNGFVAVLCGMGIWFLFGVEKTSQAKLFSFTQILIIVLVGLFALCGLFSVRMGKFQFPLLVLGMLLALNLFLAPFSQPFSAAAHQELSGKTIYFPSHFFAKHEIYRFILPGVNIRGYSGSFRHLGDTPRYLALSRRIDADIPPGFRIIDQIYNLSSRHTNKEIRDILFKGRFELLVNRLILVEKMP